MIQTVAGCASNILRPTRTKRLQLETPSPRSSELADVQNACLHLRSRQPCDRSHVPRNSIREHALGLRPECDRVAKQRGRRRSKVTLLESRGRVSRIAPCTKCSSVGVAAMVLICAAVPLTALRVGVRNLGVPSLTSPARFCHAHIPCSNIASTKSAMSQQSRVTG